MKGFNTGDGYMGMVDGEYILFASEADYYDYVYYNKTVNILNLFPTGKLSAYYTAISCLP